MTPLPASRRAIARALAAAATLLVAAAPAHATEPEAANFDARPERVSEPSPPQDRELDRLRDRLGRFGAVSLDGRTGTLRAVGRLDGFLTGPSGRDGADVALGYVRDHAASFGLDGDDLHGLQLVDRTFVRGVEHLAWEQRHRGIPIAGAGLEAAVTGAGRLVGVTGPPAADVAVRTIEPTISATAAYTVARRVSGAAPSAVTPSARTPGAERRTRFADGGHASLALFRSGERFRLGWRVLAPVSSTGVFEVLVDARNGDVVRRVNRVKSVTAKVFDVSPAHGPQIEVTLPPSWLGSDPAKLSGPNAYAFSDAGDVVPSAPDGTTWNLTPGANSDVAQADVADPLDTVADRPGDGCPGVEEEPPTTACTWDPTVPNSWTVNRRQSVTQLFYLVNRFAEFLATDPNINFTGANGGFQRTAAPLGDPNGEADPSRSDPVFAQALDGAGTGAGGRPDSAHRNNAGFLALPDGLPGFLHMSLWMPSGAAPWFGGYDGANDASLVFHEYTHGLSQRLVTDSAGYGALNEAQSGAIGEGISDYYAMDFLAQEFPALDGPGADVRVGRYVDNGDARGVRFQPLDCAPVAVSETPDAACEDRGTSDSELQRLGGLTYADFGKVFGTPEVHADGEIWAQTLWSIRRALIDEYGDEAVGVARARAIITGAMRDGMLPDEPSFLDMRNAILQASADDDDVLWPVFAERGMGYFAHAEHGDDTAPSADFTDPATLTSTATITGRVDDQDSKPLPGATVGVAGFDTGLGEQHSDATASDGTFAFDVPTDGSSIYPVIRATRGGYGSDRKLDVPADGPPLQFTLARDWSSSTAPGAEPKARIERFTGPRNDELGCGPDQLIDDNQGAVWGSSTVPGGQQIVIELARPVDIREVAIDPSAGCGDEQSAALGAYEVTGAGAANGEFRPLGGPGVFDATDIGAMTPAFSGDARGIRYVKLHAKSPQSTAPGTSGEQFMDVAEIRVTKVPLSPIGVAAETGPAPVVGFAGATVTGKVTLHGAPADVIFEYGTTTAYGAPVSAGRTGSGPVQSVVAAISGLRPATTYHYRVVALRDGRRYEGGDATFTTAAAPAPTPTPTPTPTPSPTPTPTPDPPDPVATAFKSTRLTANRRGRFKVRWTFGDAAPKGRARVSVIGKRRKRIASARVKVQPGRTITKTLRLTKSGRRMVKPGRSLRVSLELRLPGGGTLRERVRLSRKR